MFPSQGHFFSINCPDYLQGKCIRAYCHFYHNEKLLKSSRTRTSQLKSTHDDPSSKIQQISKKNVDKKQELNKYQVAHQSGKSDISQQPPLNAVAKEERKQNVEAPNLSSSEETAPDLLTQLISEAVKKVLSENSALSASAIDPDSIINSLNTTNIVSKAVREISNSQVEGSLYDRKQPKLYLPPPGTPCYQPTPIKDLINKNNKPKESDLPVSSGEEYTPTPINCSNYIETNDNGQITDFSSDEGDDDDDNECDTRSDFDMLEEVLVENLSSNPLRNKAIQKRKKALGKLATTSFPSNSSRSSKKAITTDKPEANPETAPSDDAFLPPSPVFTSSTQTSITTNSHHEQKSKDSPEQKPVDSPVNSSSDSRSNSPDEVKVSPASTSATESTACKPNPVSSKHNLLPQIAELSRPNVKSWTPVAKIESLLSVEKMLEKLDRIDSNKNSVSNNNLNKTSSNKEILSPQVEEKNCDNIKEKSPSDDQSRRNANSTAKLPKNVIDSNKGSDKNVIDSNKGSDKNVIDSNKGSDKNVIDSNKGSDKNVIDSNKGSDKNVIDSNKGSDKNVIDSNKGSDSVPEKEKNEKNSVSRKPSTESDNFSDKKRKRKKSHDEKLEGLNEKDTRERSSSSRKRSYDSEASSSDDDDERKRKRSSSSSKKKKKHKRRHSSTEDYSSESEEEYSSRDDSKERRLKRKRKHKKHRSKRSKDRRKRSKRERSRSHKRKSSHDRKSRSESSDSNSSDSSHSSPKVTPTIDSNTGAADIETTLLPIHQIKQEKIDVDLSIVKTEKHSCEPSDKSKLNNSSQLANLTTTSSSSHLKINSASPRLSKDSAADKLGDKNSRVTVKIEKISSPPANTLANSSINSSLAKIKETSVNTSAGKRPSLSKIAEKVSSTATCNKQAERSSSQTSRSTQNISQSIDKLPESSSALNKLVEKNSSNTASSSKELPQKNSLSLNRLGEKLSLHNSLDKTSSKNKLENYTSSLLQKVSDTFSSPESTKLTSQSSKDLHHKSPKSLTTSKGSNSKSKTLKEFSIFENLVEPPVKKHHSKSSSSSNKSKGIVKLKEKSKTEDKRKSGTSLQSVPHSEEGKEERRRSSSSSHSEKRKEKEEFSSSSSHSSHKRTHEERRSSNRSNNNDSLKVSKDKERKMVHESSTSKSSKRKDSTNSRASDADRKVCKDSKIDKSINNKKTTDKDLRNKNSKSRLSAKEITAGCESPIPDLSALDDLPKEDWDQLLSSPSKIENSDSDEGVDIDQTFDVDDDDGDNDDINDPRVLEECMKVFSEYDPEKNSQKTSVKKDPTKDQSNNENEPNVPVPTRKNRLAYSGAAGNLIAKPKVLVKPRRKTPAEIMLERYKKLKEEEAALQKKLELQRKELAKHGRLPSSMAISSSSVSSSSDSVPLSHPAVSSSTSAKKRIGIAPSKVNALLKSKELLKSMSTNNKNSSTPAPPPPPTTAATTNAKGSKRVAHTPKLETMERPVISTEEGTKVPQNIRQRYLNCFIDETIKFCDGDSHAYNVALAEESICHKRATTRMVYLNLAVNTLKKLRSSQISEAAQELLENDPKYQDTKEKKFSSPPVVSSSSSSVKRLEHPVNPNHRTVSHYSVMASGGQKGSWSIQKPKKTLPDNIKDYLTGIKFYNCLKKYILSIEAVEENCFPRPDPLVKGKAILKKINSRKKISPSEIERYCDRCSVLYEVDIWGLPIGNTSCVYHWGRAYKCRGIGGLETKYSCCHGDGQSEGCCLGTTHVSENFSPDYLTGYVRTIPKSPNRSGDYGVYALDCEMCYTTAGCELTRITVVDTNCKPVYETLVKPDNPIIDYNTRFSGITAEHMEGVTVKLRDVQAALLTRFSDKTILMGHSLESDFAALKIIHETVVDTSVVFPHKLGAPLKRALRNLASEYLSKIIQNDEGGHDSAEDANTCMELMHRKVKEDLKGQF